MSVVAMIIYQAHSITHNLVIHRTGKIGCSYKTIAQGIFKLPGCTLIPRYTTNFDTRKTMAV